MLLSFSAPMIPSGNFKMINSKSVVLGGVSIYFGDDNGLLEI